MSTNRGQSTAGAVGRCPTGWNTSAQNSQECFPICPANYTFKNPGTGVQANGNVDPNPSCVYNGNSRFYAPVQNVNINSPQSTFDAAKRALDARIASLNFGRIGRNNLINTAKQALLDAENARAVDPAGYQRARINYYTLVFGDTWMNDERQRIRSAVVEPAVQNYQQQALNLQNRLASQSQYSDIVRNTSESVLSAKDNFQYVVNKFSEQLDKIHVETQKKRMEAKERDLSFLGSLESILNWIIIVLLLIAVGAVGYRIYLRYAWRLEKPTAIEVDI